MDYEGVSKAVRVFGRFPVGRVLRGRPLLLQTCPRQPGGSSVSAFGGGSAGFLFLNQFGFVSLGLTFFYELAGQRWI